MITQEKYQKYLATKETLEGLHIEVAKEILDAIEEYEKAHTFSAETPIYSKLKTEAKFPLTPEKEACIVETVAALLSEETDASDPGLLLGKIQCGKTDTFENIIGLAFDKGIDIAIVLTKGTNALVNQTIMRMKDDYRYFQESENLDAAATIVIEDIMKNRKGFNRARLERAKTVIVAKKNAKNLEHLINVFTNLCPWMREKKVLIVDDEADFASRNYRSVRRDVMNDEEGNPILQNAGIKMAKISAQIDELRKLPNYCRYLQVTATPYCLFLQPDGKIDVEGGKAMPFRPRFTKLVPVHNKYIGGKQYFVDSIDETSMFSHLYHQVSQKCIDVLGHEDRRYLKSGIASGNIIGLTNALVSYLMATAIRRIQRRQDGKSYKSSAVIHVNVDKENHDWQDRLIKSMLKQIRAYFDGSTTNDHRLDFMVGDIYEDFGNSTQKAIETGKVNEDGSVSTIDVIYPSLEDVKKEVAIIFAEGDINQKVVNSDNDITSLLDENNGQLRLDSAVNIFIGGSILDRGITINNMLCFFYGRDPKKFQQDTVLQHARFYGARDLKDMAVTRLHTSDNIYQALVRMNELDDQLRQWFIAGLDSKDPNVTFVGYDSDIKPCAPSKIRPSKALAITKQKLFLPKGMTTGKANSISKTINKIEDLIKSSSGYHNMDENGIFEMDSKLAMQILHLIETTYRYDDSNKSEKSDMQELMSVMHYCGQMAGGKILAMHRTNRNMNRIRENGGWIDAPADGRTDLAPARQRAIDQPVLMLIRENGKKEIRTIGVKADGTPETMNFGWSGTPFYWPVLLTQENLNPVLFAAGQKESGLTATIDISELTEGIDSDEILSLTYNGSLSSLSEHFGEVGSIYSDADDCPVETRAIRATTTSNYLEKDSNGELVLAKGVKKDLKWAGVYTYNNGNFPFVLKPYKYLLLRTGRNFTSSAILLELYPQKDWQVFANREFDEDGNLHDYIDEETILIGAADTEIDKNRETKEVLNEDLCQWVIEYPVKKVLRYKEVTLSNRGRLAESEE